MKKQLIIAAIIISSLFSYKIIIAQNIGINTSGATPDSSAMLDIASGNKGLLIPRMDSTSRKNIVTPAKGLMVFDSTYNSFYFHDGTAWSAIGGGSDNLGNHIATQNLQLKDNWLNNDGKALEGIQIDTSGNVGINITPQGLFHVGGGKTAGSSLMVNQPSGGSNIIFLAGVSEWQSFTAPDDIFLTSIHFQNLSGVPSFNYTLYQGEGTGGAVLATGVLPNSTTVSTAILSFDEVPLERNQKYTIYISLIPSAGSSILNGSTSDVYAGGTSSKGSSTDFLFQIFAKGIKSGLLVDETGVSFENYSFPNSDGTANQVLSTNGTGVLSWNSLPVFPTSLKLLEDTDQDTKIQVEKNADEDIIRFDLNGEEKWTMQGNRLSNSQPNVFIGVGTGQNVTSGYQLVAVGDSSLLNNTEGLGNTAIGTYSLYSNTTGSFNISLGSNALPLNTTGSRNIAVGYSALMSNSTGGYNMGMGHLAGSAITSGFGNTLVGTEVGRTITTGGNNTMVGLQTGLNANNISYSTLIGAFAGSSANGADRLTAIGYQAGDKSGIGGVYLGHQAGANETGNDKLYIDNSSTATPLIWGDFATDSLVVNGAFNINGAFSFPTVDGTNGQVLETDGAGQLSWATPSGGGSTPDLDLSSNTLSLTGDPTTVDLSGYLDNTDAQDLSLSGNILSLTNDGTSVDLSGFAGGSDDLGNHTATQDIIIGSNAIQNNASSANGLSMGPENQLLVESDYQRTGYFTTTGTTLMGEPLGNYIEVSNKTGTRSIFGSDGHGLSSPTDTLNTVVGNWTTGGGITFHINAGVKAMTLDDFGRLGLGRTPTTNRLEIEGDASKTSAGNWLANSDARLKKNITSLSSNDMLNKLLSLNGVTYEWNDTQTGTKRPEGIQYGFTAQNIQDVFPSLVTKDNNGFLQTPYGTYDAMTVEAIRALNDKIEALEKENTMLKSKNKQLETNTSELADLKTAFAEIKTLLKDNKSSSTKESIESEE